MVNGNIPVLEVRFSHPTRLWSIEAYDKDLENSLGFIPRGFQQPMGR